MNPSKTPVAPRYHLRYQLVPGRRLDRDARGLVEFCRRHGVEEAVLFIAAEEWNAGLLSKRDEDLWFATVRRAKAILDRAGLHNVAVEETAGTLTDHYDPRGKVLRLSSPVYRGQNAAAVGIAAHEAGHALQDAQNYGPLVIRNAAVPARPWKSSVCRNRGPVRLKVRYSAAISLSTSSL